MKTYLPIAILTLLLAVGCASTNYVVTTKRGQEYVTKKAPDFLKKTQSYEFKDIEGREWTINREEVETIRKVKD